MKTVKSFIVSKKIFLEYGGNMKMASSKMFRVLLILVLFGSSNGMYAESNPEGWWYNLSPLLYSYTHSNACLDATEPHYANSNAIVYNCEILEQEGMLTAQFKNQTFFVQEGYDAFGRLMVKLRHSYHPKLCLLPQAMGGWLSRGVNVDLQVWDGTEEACDDPSTDWIVEKEQDSMGNYILLDGHEIAKLKNVVTGKYLSIAQWLSDVGSSNPNINPKSGKNVIQGSSDDIEHVLWLLKEVPDSDRPYFDIDDYWDKPLPPHLEGVPHTQPINTIK